MAEMGWYGYMGEVDPYQLHCLEELRRSKLRPYMARAVLWSAGGRILGDPSFSQLQRNQADVYLKTILKIIYSIEQQDMAFAGEERNGCRALLDMGHVMGWAFLEIHRATFRQVFDPSDPGDQETAIRMQLTVGAIEDHMADAYWQYVVYREAEAQNPGQTDVKWY